jgi:DNA-binding transcriptional LysR family regulator
MYQSPEPMRNTPPWFIRGRLKPRQLLLLATLAEAGTIHRAAQALNMTQPAATKLIKDLEASLGVPLFERLPRGMRPTWYGEAMIRHAREALAALGRAEEEIGALRAGHLGPVRLGGITEPCVSLLPRAVAALKARHPELRIAVELETSDVLLQRLLGGRIDVMIGRILGDVDASLLHYIPLVEEPVAAIVRPGHPLLAAPGLRLADLTAARWVLPPPGSVLRVRFEQMFHAQGIAPPEDIIDATALIFVTRMLEESDALAVIAHAAARYYERAGVVRILPLTLPCTMDTFGLILRRDRIPSPALRLVLAALTEAAREIYGVSLTLPPAFAGGTGVGKPEPA